MAATKAAKYTKELAEHFYETMCTIRKFEESVKHDFLNGEIPGFVHLYIGEEAIATGVCSALRKDDMIESTHRGHGHCVAKGADVNRMMAEIFGKKTGLCQGRGGSMHIADFSVGMLGANGVVGGGYNLATGAALASKMILKNDRVSVVFFGDGASNRGTFHEAMNVASAWKLPVIFVNEMNCWASTTPYRTTCNVENISDRAWTARMSLLCMRPPRRLLPVPVPAKAPRSSRPRPTALRATSWATLNCIVTTPRPRRSITTPIL